MVALSVVIPTYRKPELLARTLDALAAQRVVDPDGWEVVVVDDGSDDGRTPGVIQSAARRLEVVVAGSGRNEGRARARNRGWRNANGRWILFLDDDIVLDAGAVQAHLSAQRECEAVHLGQVVTAPEIVDSPLFTYLDSRGVAKCDPGESVPSRYLLTQNVSIPRRCLEEIGGFDEDFGAYGFEDMEIAFRLEDRTGIGFRVLRDARGEHVHHHTLDEYLEKKRVCGRETLARLAELHPHRLEEMRLDVLPGLGERASAGRRWLARLLRLSWNLGLPTLAHGIAARWPLRGPAAVRDRLYDYLVLHAYAEGLRVRDKTARQAQ